MSRRLESLASWISGTVAFFVGLVSLSAVVIIGYNQSAQADCVSRWADRYTESARIRSAATTARLDALHKLFFDLVNDPATAQKNDDHVAFVRAVESGDPAAIKKAATAYANDLTMVSPIITQDVINFQRTEEAYQDAITNHPLPESPKLICERRLF